MAGFFSFSFDDGCPLRGRGQFVEGEPSTEMVQWMLGMFIEDVRKSKPQDAKRLETLAYEAGLTHLGRKRLSWPYHSR